MEEIVRSVAAAKQNTMCKAAMKDTSNRPSALMEATKFDKAETFWSTLPTKMVEKAEPEAVLSMTKSLFKYLLTEQKVPDILQKAFHLASQLRTPKDINKLLIDIDELKENTKFDPAVLDLSKYEHADFKIKCPNSAKFYEECFTTETEKHAVYWGPLFACFLLRCVDLPVFNVLSKLKGFASTVQKFYVPDKTNRSLYTLSSCPNFDSFLILMPFAKRLHLPSLRLNTALTLQCCTLYYSFISAYHKDDASPTLKSFLDCLILNHLRNRGIEVFYLIDQLVGLLECTPGDLATEYCYPQCILSWEQFFQYEKQYFDELKKAKFWCYISIFTGSQLTKFGFVKNYFLCNLLAFHIDLIRTSSKRRSVYLHLHSFYSDLCISDSEINNSVSSLNILGKEGQFRMGTQQAEERLTNAAKLASEIKGFDYKDIIAIKSKIPHLSLIDINYIILSHTVLLKDNRSASAPLFVKDWSNEEDKLNTTDKSLSVNSSLTTDILKNLLS